MKDSGVEWIGEVPKGWDVVRIKDKYIFDTGFTPDTKHPEYYIDEDGFEWATITDIKNGKVTFPTKSTISRDYVKMNHKKQIPAGCLLYSFKLSVGEIAKTDRPLFTNEAIACFYPNHHINIDFLKYSASLIEYNANTNIYGAKILNQQLINDAIVVFPPLEVQKSIANFLDQKCSEIDSLSADIQSQIDVLEEYKKSVITEAVTKGLNPDVEMKDSGVEWIGMIPAHWFLSRLKYNLSTPMKYGASEAGVDYSEGLPRYIRITDITSDGKLKEDGKLSLTLAQASNYLLTDDTVLFARSGGTVGKTFLYTKECGLSAFAGYLISGVTNKAKMLPKWLWYFSLSNSYWEWANQIFTQATIQNIGADKYSNLPITAPNIHEQKEIIMYLDTKCAEIDAIIVDKKAQLETLAEYKKSLIYEYVTGKKEIK